MNVILIDSGVGPTFLERFPEQVLDPGPSVSLRCIASGHPLPQVTWLLDGYPVPDNSRLRTGDYVTKESVVVSYVNITSVVPSDGGLYVSLTSPYFTPSSLPCLSSIHFHCMLPPCTRPLPSNSQSFPSNSQSFPSDSQSFPSNSQSFPSDSQSFPSSNSLKRQVESSGHDV